MKEYRQIPFERTDVDGGFWLHKQKLVRDTSVYAIYDRFSDTHRFDFFENDWDSSKKYAPHIFWDSDVAKWMETAAFLLAKKNIPELSHICETVVDAIEQYQEESGYFNSFYQKVEKDMRWKDRSRHELYCAGHLMEAAVAYYNATGRDKMLRLMEKYADYIKKVFMDENAAAFRTPGHEEIELALVKMYRATGNRKYLEMSLHFVDERGRGIEADNSAKTNSKYNQSHLPVREQTTAEGHSVRAVYLYCAMADLAYELGDKGLLKASERLFENIAEKRMYVTGGIGSAREGEAFTVDYDLQNITAYTESCATLGLALFCRRMSLIRPDSRYADIAERCIYNGFLSSISLDGRSFFYENPLEIHPYLASRHASMREQTRMPDMQRQEVFSCSCCPPNITRFIASVADFLYTYSDDTLYVHQYMNAKTEMGENVIRQETAYPADGAVTLTVSGAFKQIALRIPGWCGKFVLKLNGKSAQYFMKSGYACLALDEGVNTVDINLEMEPFLMECNPNVFDDAGKVALQRGPVVYCLEAVDNGENLCDIRLLKDRPFETVKSDYFVPDIEATGVRRSEEAFEGLYRKLKEHAQECKIKFIPYFAFANRGESEMLVWVRA